MAVDAGPTVNCVPFQSQQRHRLYRVRCSCFYSVSTFRILFFSGRGSANLIHTHTASLNKSAGATFIFRSHHRAACRCWPHGATCLSMSGRTFPDVTGRDQHEQCWQFTYFPFRSHFPRATTTTDVPYCTRITQTA